MTFGNTTLLQIDPKATLVSRPDFQFPIVPLRLSGPIASQGRSNDITQYIFAMKT